MTRHHFIAEALMTATSDPVEEPRSAASGGDGVAPTRRKPHYLQRILARYKLWHLLLLTANLVIAAAGFFAVWRTLHNSAHVLRNSVQQSVVTQVVALDRLMIDRPELYPYFYNCKPLAAGDTLYTTVRSAGMMYLDVFDIVSSQNTIFKTNWENPELWNRWIVDTFAHSPALRDLLRNYSHWYGPRLNGLRKQAEEEVRTGARLVPPCPAG
jgi:hypothetical protein